MTLCVLNEKQDKGNLGQKGLSDNTKVDFGATKNHGYQWVFDELQDCTTTRTRHFYTEVNFIQTYIDASFYFHRFKELVNNNKPSEILTTEEYVKLLNEVESIPPGVSLTDDTKAAVVADTAPPGK